MVALSAILLLVLGWRGMRSLGARLGCAPGFGQDMCNGLSGLALTGLSVLGSLALGDLGPGLSGGFEAGSVWVVTLVLLFCGLPLTAIVVISTILRGNLGREPARGVAVCGFGSVGFYVAMLVLVAGVIMETLY